jgi:predicted transcriptional regulator
MYEKVIKLKHNERAAKIDLDTGEVAEVAVHNREKKQPKDPSMNFFISTESYSRFFTKAWQLLETQTTDTEFKVAYKMSMMAHAYTNSLEPLRPESTMKELSEFFNVDRRKIQNIIEKLFKLGVIGKFQVYDRFENHHNYWVFNPYLSFNGKIIKKDVQSLFNNTHYAALSPIL